MDCESLAREPMLSRLLAGDGMRRDLDYLRQMLADMEASPEWQHLIGFDEGADDSDTESGCIMPS